MFNITVSKPSDLFEGIERFAEDVMPSFL